MAGVYVSYPFCSRKCTYCNFASGVMPPSLEGDYGAALVREIGSHVWTWTPETVYLGGGSPSRMPPQLLQSVLDAIPGRPWLEATIETAPEEITPGRARLWHDLGLTRASLGVQSFSSSELRRTGRVHNAATVSAGVELLRQAGFGHINIDLIAGLPGQTAASWELSLDWVERLQPDHVSVYMLEVDEDSRLGLEILHNGSRYGAREVPPEAVVVELYDRAVERLGQLGLRRYEISNFARPGCESLHNLKYWRLEPYAGFGADAHGFDGLLRFRNAESARDYVAAMRERGSARVECIPCSPDEERFFVGLRLMEGIRPQPADWTRHAAVIARYTSQGLLERDGGVLRLTPRGVLFSNEVLEEFIGV